MDVKLRMWGVRFVGCFVVGVLVVVSKRFVVFIVEVWSWRDFGVGMGLELLC